MSGNVVCFGELLLRLGAPDRELLLQSPRLDVHVGGAEANVAISLARFGHAVSMASVLPANALGEHVLGELRRHGVDTRAVQRGDGRMGLYFLATGAGVRPSEVLYDRADSAFARAAADAFDWDTVLAGADMLHLSGVTPALGPRSAEAALRAARAGRTHGCTVVFDGNYRSKLWETWSGDAPSILRNIIECADIAFADHRDVAIVLGRSFDEDTPLARFTAAAQAAFEAFPTLRKLVSTHREQHSVEHHSLGAMLATRAGGVHTAPAQALHAIVDRIGGGDAFAAGVLHGLRSGMDDPASLRFGLGAGCLKHTVPGDFNRVSAEDVNASLSDTRLDVRR